MPGRQLVARWWEDLAVVYMYTIDTHCVRCCRIWSRRLPHRSPRSCHGLPGRTGQTRRQPVGRPASNCTGPTGARSARSRSRRPRRSTCRPAQCRRPRRTEGWCAGRGARAWLQLRVPWLPVVLVVSGRCGCVVVAVVVAVVVVVAAGALADAISVCTRVSLRQCLHFVIDSTEADLDLRSKSCPPMHDGQSKFRYYSRSRSILTALSRAASWLRAVAVHAGSGDQAPARAAREADRGERGAWQSGSE